MTRAPNHGPIAIRPQLLRRRQLLAGIADRIRSADSVDAALAYAVHSLSQVFPGYRVTYSTIPRRGHLRCLICGAPAHMADLTGFEGDLRNAPEFQTMLQKPGPLIYGEVDQDPLFKRYLRGRRVESRTFMAMPLQYHADLLGVLAIGSAVERKWSRRETDLLREVANYLTLAVAASRADQARRNAIRRLDLARDELRRAWDESDGVVHRERTRIGRELHDVLGQSLTALQIEASRFAQRASSALPTTRLRGLLDSVLATVQNLSAQLRGGSPERVDLESALRLEVRSFRAWSGLRCSLSAPPSSAVLRPESRIAILRVLQEALTNVARHARASRVGVRLDRQGAWFRLTVLDDGMGIDLAAGEAPTALGISGMRQWAMECGGRLEVRRRNRRGTRVCLLIPLTPGKRA